MLQINGSIAAHDSCVYCSCRTSGLYKYDPKSFLFELDEEFNVLSTIPITAENGNTAFEDVRIVSYKDCLLAFYNYLPMDGDGKWYWKYIMGYGRLDVKTGVIENQISMHEMSHRYNEKNWIPYTYNEELYLVTDFDPYLRILKIDDLFKANSVSEHYRSKARTNGWPYGEIRGGTSLLAPGGGQSEWLYGFVHSFLFHHRDYNRFYYFTVVRLNHSTKDLEIHRVPLELDLPEPDEDQKLLWTISNHQNFKVVFPMGMMHYQDGVIVSFGIDDVYTTTNFYSWNYLEGLFT